MRRLTLTALLVVVACHDVTAPADSAFVYVSPSGLDAAPGTPASPKRTVAAGIAAAVLSGRTGVRLLPGRYAPSTTGEVFPIALASNITIEADDTLGATVLDAEGTAGVVRADSVTDAVLRGVTLRGGSADLGAGLYVRAASLRAERLTLRDNVAGRHGSGVYVGSGDLTLARSVVAFNRSAPGADAHGVHVEGGTARIHNNVIALHDSNGLLVTGAGTGDIRNNIFYRNGQTAPQARGRGICEVTAARASVIRFNIFFANVSAALLVSGSGDISPEQANGLSPTDGIESNFTADPLFVFPDAGDFRLGPGSPAVNAGEPDALFNDRNGTRNDIGHVGGR